MRPRPRSGLARTLNVVLASFLLVASGATALHADPVPKNRNPFVRFACALISDIFVPQFAAQDRRYFEPLIADPRAAQTNAIIGSAKSVPFLEHQPNMQMWDVDVGAELPIVGGEHQCRGESRRTEGSGSRGHVGLHEWGFGLWFPIDFHMIESLNDPSAPILNTDYRFNAMLKGEFVYAQDPNTGEHRIAARVRVGHESTHLGDEYSIRAQLNDATQFERINVSYQYVDAAIGLNGDFDHRTYSYTSQLGLVHTALPWNSSYYDTDANPDLTISPIGAVTPTTRNYEPYVGVQLTRADLNVGLVNSVPVVRWFANWSAYVSVDSRDKTVYNYHKPTPNAPDQTEWSTNAIVGVRPPDNSIVSFELRGYYGLNPYGQFRNETNFWLFGFGVHLNALPIN